MEKQLLYLDDVRVPVDKNWILVKNYDEFVNKVNEIGLENFMIISLDHDLGMEAMREWYRTEGEEINYDNIIGEKTGMDCAKFLVELSMDTGIPLPTIFVHSANNVGSENITSYINQYKLTIGDVGDCIRTEIPFTCPDALF